VESQKQLAEALGIYSQRLRIREAHDEVLGAWPSMGCALFSEYKTPRDPVAHHEHATLMKCRDNQTCLQCAPSLS
jgi:hypothetical protein